MSEVEDVVKLLISILFGWEWVEFDSLEVARKMKVGEIVDQSVRGRKGSWKMMKLSKHRRSSYSRSKRRFRFVAVF